ncbi:MAG: 2-C-methyl-D-erythritol 2 4-cyclodiphosphate synthase [Erysipelotrichaceae bacterium]|nr:MAG: 2-C-methyl-D-erythritol 2 4-cyclodiphosphate [Erysipelotrichaceae bacterium]TXT19969.1 MAG: 2-C-methyl-D-erythritol 2 4-cyclodiphosphate synthase [Erysipelotrichaceae bacterium]
MRIGQSTDIHPLVEGRPLILGGVLIEHNKGCLGHSDADALTHVIAEAILGALALGDLGKHFPDTDPKYKGIRSLLILQEVVLMMNQRNYKVGNIDALILIEKPKMAPHILAMKENLCAILQCQNDQLNIKATRGEGLGFIGHEEGVVAQAVVLLEEIC